MFPCLNQKWLGMLGGFYLICWSSQIFSQFGTIRYNRIRLCGCISSLSQQSHESRFICTETFIKIIWCYRDILSWVNIVVIRRLIHGTDIIDEVNLFSFDTFLFSFLQMLAFLSISFPLLLLFTFTMSLVILLVEILFDIFHDST